MAIIEQSSEKLHKGKGELTITHLLTPKELTDKCAMFAKVTIPVGASLDVHSHIGNTETYYILQGEGMYTDNDKEYKVSAGTTTFCADGDKHGIENIGNEDLIFMALIINS